MTYKKHELQSLPTNLNTNPNAEIQRNVLQIQVSHIETLLILRHEKCLKIVVFRLFIACMQEKISVLQIPYLLSLYYDANVSIKLIS